jgi:predicted SnoaL-like aldol condensation-catalyzing enzyme
VAERDLVILVQADEQNDPYPYTTTWFDMFRVDNGLITEHWDHGTLPKEGTPRDYVPVTENLDHQTSLLSTDPGLEHNKKRVYDMWRVLLDAQQVEEAPKYLAKDYIQHNPMADSGLDGFMSFFRQFAQPRSVEPHLKNFVEIAAEGDLVVLATVSTYSDANGNPYTTTWFDMFRVENGMMVEHWDTARLPVGE